MPLHARTAKLCFCLVLLAASTAGCLGGSEISGSDARERALAAEEQHIPDQLENASCVTGWSPTSFVGLEERI